MTDLGTMSVKFGADISGLISGISSAKSFTSGFASTLGGLGLAIGAIGIGVGVVATKMAGDFQAGITSLVTGAGEAQKNVKLVSDGILNLAVSTGTTTKQLTDGMYMIESAGFHGADGLKVLQSAAEGAKVGNADLASVANGVTTALTDYHLPASQAVAVTNDLVATVAAGKTHMQDLANALSTILPTASAAGISLKDTTAALATMTGEGTGAAQASTYLRQTILALEAPSSGAAKELKSVGLTTDQVAAEMKVSLPGALQLITDAVGKKFPVGSAEYIAAIKGIVGGTKNLQGVLELTGTHLSTFKDNVRGIGDAVKKGGSSIAGWTQVQGDFNQQMAVAKEVVETLMIKIGTALLPVLGNLLGKITPIITQFGEWLTSGNRLQNGINAVVGAITTMINVGTGIVSFFQNNQVALTALGIVLVAVAGAIIASMVVAFYAWAVAATAAAIATLAATWPILAIGAAIALLVVGIILAVQHWGQITAWLSGVWSAFVSWFMGLWNGMVSWIQGVLGKIGGFFTGVWHGIQAGTQAAWNAIVNAVKVGAQFVLDVITGPFRAIGALFVWLYEHNTYFQKLIDAIVSIVQAGVAWLQNAWNTVINWIIVEWTFLKTSAEILFLRIYLTIQEKVNQAASFLRSIWTSVVGFLSGIWNTIMTGVSTLWNNISHVFSSAWGTYIAGPLGTVRSNIITFFSNLASTAVSWGVNLIQGFINGIGSMLGAVGNAAANIMNTVKGFLGFHSPAEQGPGKDLDIWGPNLVKGFSQGIVKNIPQVQAAVNLLVAPVAKVAPQAYPSTGGGSSVVSSSASGNAANGGNQQITIYLDSTVLAQAIGNKQAQLIQIKTGVRQW